MSAATSAERFIIDFLSLVSRCTLYLLLARHIRNPQIGLRAKPAQFMLIPDKPTELPRDPPTRRCRFVMQHDVVMEWAWSAHLALRPMVYADPTGG
jgi:hypothetical protein